MTGRRFGLLLTTATVVISAALVAIGLRLFSRPDLPAEDDYPPAEFDASSRPATPAPADGQNRASQNEVVETPTTPEVETTVVEAQAAPPQPARRLPEADVKIWLSEALQLEDQREREAALFEIGARLASEDFEFAVGMIQSVEDWRARGHIVNGLFRTYAAVDPKAALELAWRLQPQHPEGRPQGREQWQAEFFFRGALGAVLKQWSVQDSKAALAYLDELPDAYRHRARGAVYAGWAEVDPQGALEQALSGSDSIHHRTLAGIYDEWARQDPATAADHAASHLESGRYRSMVLGSVLENWAEEDLPSALDWIDTAAANDEEYASLLRSMARRLSRSNPVTAAELLSGFPELDRSDHDLTHDTVREWVRRDPGSAAAWALTLADMEQRSTSVKTVASDWVRRDYDSAFSWAMSLAGESDRAWALSNIALRQAEASLERPADWITRLPDGFARDRSVAGYALGTIRRTRDYGTARRLQSLMGDQSVDLNAVRGIVEQARLDESVRQHLLSMF